MTKKITLTLEGLHCASCKVLIEDVAGDIKGIKSCTVDSDKGTAVIEYQEKKNLEEFKKEVEGLGKYKVTIK